MQTVNNILKIAGGETTITDEYGKKIAAPAVKIGISYLLNLDLRSDIPDEETGILLPLSWDQVKDVQSFYLCVDGDWDHNTTPKLLSASNIKVEQSEDGRTLLIAVLPNTLREALIEVINKKKNISLMCEIGGYKVIDAGEGTTETIFCFNFDLVLQNRLYYGDGEIPEEIETNPNYLTRSETIALINEFLRSDVAGPEGDSAYDVATKNGFVGTEEEWLASLKGTVGKSAYDIAVELGFEGTEEEWLASLNGINGNDGLSAYALALENGYNGTLEAWLEDLKGQDGESAYQIAVRVDGFTGTEAEWLASLQGKDGNGICYDAFGTPEDKPLYDGSPKGFRFLASVNDDTIRINTVYIWEKLSDNSADWSEPLVIKNYGNTQVTTVWDAREPLLFEREAGQIYDYLTYELKDLPYAYVSAVSIIVDGKEEFLPMGSSLGITKILKNKDEHTVYWGGGAMSRGWTQGYVYFNQFVTPINTSPISPVYGGDMYYGYVQDATMTSVKGITWAILQAAINANTMKKSEAKVLTKTSIGNPPAGSYIVVIVPETNYVVYKDNGFGGITNFAENTSGGASGTGANGAEITLNEVKYKIYGEFQLTNSEVSIYVSNTK